jgi:DNA replication protein DnaC
MRRPGQCRAPGDLQDELDRRQSRLIERRYKLSGLEEKLTLAEFDWGFNPRVPRQACFQLRTLKFIAVGDNALIISKPSTGKSHVAKAVAYQAVLQGHKVQYLETDDFFNR